MRSVTVTASAQRLRPISLDLGHPGVPPPPEAMRQAAEELARSSRLVAYPPPQGRTALCQAIGCRSGVEVEAVTVTHGASGALTAAVLATTAPGDEVLCPDPGYPAFAAVATAVGRRTARYAADDVDLLEQQVAEALTPATRLVIVNSPSNPLGTVVPQAALDRIAALVADHGAFLLSDEVYAELAFGRVASHARPGGSVITIHSFSKAYGLAGFRVGYALAQPELAFELARAHWRLNMSVSGVGQAAATGALAADDVYLERTRLELAQRRDDVCGLLAAADVPHRRPDAGLFIWICTANAGVNGATFATICRTKAALAVSPGTPFGPNGADQVRLSFGGAPEDAWEGTRRLCAVYRGLLA